MAKTRKQPLSRDQWCRVLAFAGLVLGISCQSERAIRATVLSQLGSTRFAEPWFADFDVWSNDYLAESSPDIHEAAKTFRRAHEAAIKGFADGLHARALLSIAYFDSLGKAIEDLRRARLLEPTTYEIATDLAAALLLSYRESGRLTQLIESLEISIRASRLEPNRPAGLFNLALALTDLDLVQEAIDTFERVLALLPHSSPWSKEIESRLVRLHERRRSEEESREEFRDLKNHLQEARGAEIADLIMKFPLRSIEVLRQYELSKENETRAEKNWNAISRAILQSSRDPSLTQELETNISSRTYRALRRVAEAYERFDLQDMAHGLEDARELVTDRSHPLNQWFVYYQLLYDHVTLRPTSRKAIEDLMATIDPIVSPTIAAFLSWLAGLEEMRAGKIASAFQYYEEASEGFRKLNMRRESLNMHVLVADLAYKLGDYTFAWESISPAIQKRHLFVRSKRQRALLELATRLTEAHGWLEASLVFQSAAARAVSPLDSALVRVEVQLHGARTRALVGQTHAATASLSETERLFEEIGDPTLRKRLNEEKLLVEAQIAGQLEPKTASERYGQLLRGFSAPRFRLLELSLLRTRAEHLLSSGQESLAQRDLDRAIEVALEVRPSLRMTATGNRFFSEIRHIVSQQLQLATDDATKLRILSEYRRITDWSHLSPPLPDLFEPDLRSGVAILVPFITENSISSVLINHRSLESSSQSLAPGEFFEPQRALLGTADERRAALTRLSKVLLAPFAEPLQSVDCLLVVDDEGLSGVPLSLLKLRDAQAESPLFEVARVPTLRAARTAERVLCEEGNFQPTGPILVLADPTPADQWPPLPYARKEARAIADSYHGETTLLLGDQATTDAFKKHASKAEIIHIGAHATWHWTDPKGSALILSTALNGPSLLNAETVSRAELRASVVFLASCGAPPDTATPRRNHLVDAFQRAGVPVIVAATGLVKDQAASTFARRFHQEFSNGSDVSTAFQHAHLAAGDNAPAFDLYLNY